MFCQKVVAYKELCQILEIPEEEPQMEPSRPNSHPTDIHAFLASPTSTNKRYVWYQQGGCMDQNLMVYDISVYLAQMLISYDTMCFQ